MSRVGDVKFIPTAVANGGPKAPVALDQIPEEIRQEVEEFYTLLKQNPNGNLRIQFTDRTELLQWENMVRSYCEQRSPEIVYRRSPVKKETLPEGCVHFTVKDPKPKNGTEEIRAAVDKVNAAAPIQSTGRKSTGRKVAA